jgi:hypothetical protein
MRIVLCRLDGERLIRDMLGTHIYISECSEGIYMVETGAIYNILEDTINLVTVCNQFHFMSYDTNNYDREKMFLDYIYAELEKMGV